MAHSSDLGSSDTFMSEKEAGYIGGSENSHDNNSPQPFTTSNESEF